MDGMRSTWVIPFEPFRFVEVFGADDFEVVVGHFVELTRVSTGETIYKLFEC